MKLSSVVNRINGNVDRFTTDLKYYIGGEHFESNELAITKKGLLKENLNILGFKFHFAFQERDIIFMARNPHLRKAGMVMFSGLCSDASYILRSKDENILTQEFLAVQLQSDHFWDYCESHKVGSVNFANNWSSIANYEFDLPPVEVQRKIGEKVWAAYRVKESYKKLLAATDDMLKAKFMEMKNAASQMVSLSTICFVQKGSNLTRNNAIDGIYPVVAGGQIPSCYHNTYNREGHVISVSASGAYAGFVNYWKNPIYASDCNTIISKSGDIVETYFVYLGLKAMQNEVYKLQKGGAQPHVYGSDLELFSFPIIEKKLQQQFVEIATQAEATKESLRKSIENIDQVIKSLINQ